MYTQLIQYSIFTFAGCVFLFLIGFGIDNGIKEIDNLLVPCQHGTSFYQGMCRCDGTPFNGTYCSNCMCEHGSCSMSPAGEYGCRCPSNTKYYGFLCDQCNTVDDACKGDCLPGYYGPKCDTTCDANGTYTPCIGTCNMCHGHGTCDNGNCECDKDWFNNGLYQCNITCPPCAHGACELYGGSPSCVCEKGWHGTSCDIPCPGLIGQDACSGHGTCSFDGTTTCLCEERFQGEDCSIECPGDVVACNGHGTCTEGVCECQTNVQWSQPSCKCADELTCNARGTCVNETCECFGNFGGDHCLTCKENWHGDNCDTFCNPYTTCNGHGTCYDGKCVCNLDTTKRIFKDGLLRDFVSYYSPELNCGECVSNYFPKQAAVDEHGLPAGFEVPCQETCEPTTCNFGICNTNFGAPGEHLCDCPGHISDESFCLECEEHWYTENCNRYCIASGTLECDGNTDCVQCNGHGTCSEEGDCICEGDYTGKQCQILCNGCGGHGTCEMNDVQTLMEFEFKETGDPLFGCTCDPQDPIDAGARLDWDERKAEGLVNGTLDPPPDPDYYGDTCTYFCSLPPWDNSIECNGKGNCTVKEMIKNNNVIPCQTDTDCANNLQVQQLISADPLWTSNKGPFCHRKDEIAGCDKSADDCYEILLKQRPKAMRSEPCVSNSTCYAAIENEDWHQYCTDKLAKKQPTLFQNCKSVESFCPSRPIPALCKTYVELTDGKDVSYKVNLMYEQDKKRYPHTISEYRSNESAAEHDAAEEAFRGLSVPITLSPTFCPNYVNRYPTITSMRENKMYVCNGELTNDKACNGTLADNENGFYKPFTVCGVSYETYEEAIEARTYGCKVTETNVRDIYIYTYVQGGQSLIDSTCKNIRDSFPSCKHPLPCDFNPCTDTCTNSGNLAICSTTGVLNSTCLKGTSTRLSFSSYSCNISYGDLSCPRDVTFNTNYAKFCKDNNPIVSHVNSSAPILSGSFVRFTFKAPNIIGSSYIDVGPARVFVRQGQIQLNGFENIQACPVTNLDCHNTWGYEKNKEYDIELEFKNSKVIMRRGNSEIVRDALTNPMDYVTVSGSAVFTDITVENDIPSPHTCTYETCDLNVSYRRICSDIIRNVEYPMLEPKHDILDTCSNLHEADIVISATYNETRDVRALDWDTYCTFYNSLGDTSASYLDLENYPKCEQFIDPLDGSKTCILNALDYNWTQGCEELAEATIPDTIKSACPNTCYNHLKTYDGCEDRKELFSDNTNVIDTCSHDWYTYCLNDAKGALPGTCSAVECSCSRDAFAGISGEACELQCPMSMDGTACAEGSNMGVCDYTDAQKQIIENNGTFTEVFALDGVCKCFHAEGDGSCDVECQGCNNGMYPGGQIGICDTSRGLCDCLPPFTEISEYVKTDWRGKNVTILTREYNTGGYTGENLTRIKMMQGRESFLNINESVFYSASVYTEFVEFPERYGFDRHTVTLLHSLEHSSSRFNFDCNSVCPGTSNHLSCSGHGACGISGQCICDPARLSSSIQLINGEAEVISEPTTLERTGYRGDDCSITCPGFDGDMSNVCSGHGTCNADGECACAMGYIGEECEFPCPVNENVCSGHGTCELVGYDIIEDVYEGLNTTCEYEASKLDCMSYADENGLNFTYEYREVQLYGQKSYSREYDRSLGGTMKCVGRIVNKFPVTNPSYNFNGILDFDDGSSVQWITDGQLTNSEPSDFPIVCAARVNSDHPNSIGLYEVPVEGICKDGHNWSFPTTGVSKLCMNEKSLESDENIRGPVLKSLKETECSGGHVDVITGACQEKALIETKFYFDRDTHYEQEVTARCRIGSGNKVVCGVCECFKDDFSGHWGDRKCGSCQKGFGGGQCTNECLGGVMNMCNGRGKCLYGSTGNVFQPATCLCNSQSKIKDNKSTQYFIQTLDSLQRAFVQKELTCDPSANTDVCSHFATDDCSICASGYTGSKCDKQCWVCLNGGFCIVSEVQGSSSCEKCGSEKLWSQNCCPVGFIIPGVDELNAAPIVYNDMKINNVYQVGTTNLLDASYWCKACPGVLSSDWLAFPNNNPACANQGTCSRVSITKKTITQVAPPGMYMSVSYTNYLAINLQECMEQCKYRYISYSEGFGAFGCFCSNYGPGYLREQDLTDGASATGVFEITTTKEFEPTCACDSGEGPSCRCTRESTLPLIDLSQNYGCYDHGDCLAELFYPKPYEYYPKYWNVYIGYCSEGEVSKGSGYTVETCYNECSSFLGFDFKKSTTECWCSTLPIETCTKVHEVYRLRYDINPSYTAMTHGIGCSTTQGYYATFDGGISIEPIPQGYVYKPGYLTMFTMTNWVTTPNHVKPCPVGSKGNTDLTTCEACAPGKYQDETGQPTCKTCPAGQYSYPAGSTDCFVAGCENTDEYTGGATLWDSIHYPVERNNIYRDYAYDTIAVITLQTQTVSTFGTPDTSVPAQCFIECENNANCWAFSRLVFPTLTYKSVCFLHSAQTVATCNILSPKPCTTGDAANNLCDAANEQWYGMVSGTVHGNQWEAETACCKSNSCMFVAQQFDRLKFDNNEPTNLWYEVTSVSPNDPSAPSDNHYYIFEKNVNPTHNRAIYELTCKA